eukprot:1082383-Pyramimonas_sp.AAC.1
MSERGRTASSGRSTLPDVAVPLRGQAPHVLSSIEREHPGPDAARAFDKYPSQATASSAWKGSESRAWRSTARLNFRPRHSETHRGPLRQEGWATQIGMG